MDTVLSSHRRRHALSCPAAVLKGDPKIIVITFDNRFKLVVLMSDAIAALHPELSSSKEK